MDVGEAWHDQLARAVNALGRGVARQDVGVRADRGDAIGFDGDRGVVVDRVAIVDGGDHGIVDNGGQGFPLLVFPITGRGVAESKGNASISRPVNKNGLNLACRFSG